MEVAELDATQRRVAMVWPPVAMVTAPYAELRAERDASSELVDQVHHHEHLRVLASRDGWHFVQADDHYFGWIAADVVRVLPSMPDWRVIAVALAAVHVDPDVGSPTIAVLPAGTPLGQYHPAPEGPWTPVGLGSRRGYVSHDDCVRISDLPHRPPTVDDLIATGEAFLGVPYLWGGTTGIGIDCSGFVQQVYRLNGLRLDRDADQQAMEGRSVDAPARGDLVFFGRSRVTHVGLARDERTMLNSLGGKGVRVDDIAGIGVGVLAIRRYLP